jgi:hypothetical protein
MAHSSGLIVGGFCLLLFSCASQLSREPVYASHVRGPAAEDSPVGPCASLLGGTLSSVTPYTALGDALLSSGLSANRVEEWLTLLQASALEPDTEFWKNTVVVEVQWLAKRGGSTENFVKEVERLETQQTKWHASFVPELRTLKSGVSAEPDASAMTLDGPWSAERVLLLKPNVRYAIRFLRPHPSIHGPQWIEFSDDALKFLQRQELLHESVEWLGLLQMGVARSKDESGVAKVYTKGGDALPFTPNYILKNVERRDRYAIVRNGSVWTVVGRFHNND